MFLISYVFDLNGQLDGEICGSPEPVQRRPGVGDHGGAEGDDAATNDDGQAVDKHQLLVVPDAQDKNSSFTRTGIRQQ